jgi:hypothetical protein
VEVLPLDTNRGPSFPGRQVRLGFRKPTLSTCSDEVLAALAHLTAKSSKQVFTVSEVFDKMVESGTTYAEGTVFKTMQTMKVPATRPPYTRLERVGRQGFRLKEVLRDNGSDNEYRRERPEMLAPDS